MSMPASSAMEGGRGSGPRLSSVAVETADVKLDERQMYAVEWREGAALGFTVTPVNSDRGTVLLLARRTARRAQIEEAGLQDVVPGDMLVAIGDEKVYHLGAENATKYLRSVRKPVRLTLQLSPYGNTGKKNLPDLAPNEYHYLWEDGPLGIVLTYDLKSKLPMVKRLSDKANDTVRRDVQVGDQLVYANDVPSSEYTMDEVMSILREMPKPVLLRFRKQLADDLLVELPELAENEFEFLWDYGPLGLVIGMSRSGLPFVRSFTGLGTSRQLPLVQEYDEIVMVNDKSAQKEGFREIMQYLMNVPKPAVLRFRRKIRGMDDRDSTVVRASTKMRDSKGQERPSSVIPDYAAPEPIPTYPGVHEPAHLPPSPQVRVSLDRSRFRSVSSSRDDRSSTCVDTAAATEPPITSPAHRPSSTHVNGRETPTGLSAEEIRQFEDAKSPLSNSGSTTSEDRETAILPPDPRMNNMGAPSRSSIFTFRFDDEPQMKTAPAAPVPPQPETTRRIAVKTGSMPPEAFITSNSIDEPPAHKGTNRSQSSRPVTNAFDTVDLSPEPVKVAEPVTIAGAEPVSEVIVSPVSPPASVPVQPTTNVVGEEPIATVAVATTAIAADAATAQSVQAAPATSAQQRAVSPVVVAPVREVNVHRAPVSKPAVVTAEVVAEPVKKTQNTKQYMDTAELVAEALVGRKVEVDNQREHAVIATSVKRTKTRPTSVSNQYEDTGGLTAEPTSRPISKSYQDTAELVAEALVEKKEATVARSKAAYLDTANLVAEPTPAKKQVPAKKQYEDTADLVAEPVNVKATNNQYEDTADLVAEPAKPNKPYIDTAELVADAPAPAPKPALSATSKPIASAPTPTPAPTPVAPAASMETQEYFTIDESAFYTVQWTEGPFGSTVREADSSSGPVMLITKRTGKQTCKGLRRIAVGDILVRIGDKDIPSMGFEKATRYLRKVPKPVPLTFQAID